MVEAIWQSFWFHYGEPILTALGILLGIALLLFVLTGGRIGKGTQRKEDDWTVVIADGADRVDVVFERIRELLMARNLPGVREDRVKVRPLRQTRFRGGETRRFLVVDPPRRYEAKLYRIYTGVRSYGRELQISWYLMLEPGFFRRTLARLLSLPAAVGNPRLVWDPFWLWEGLSVFGHQDLSAHASVVHACVKEVMNETMAELGQDSSKVDTKSRGILGLW